MADESPSLPPPLIQPLGDRGLIVRFAMTLSDEANRAAIGFARRVRQGLPEGVSEIDPNLVSVLLKYDPGKVSFERLAGEVRLLLGDERAVAEAPARQVVGVVFDGADLTEVATSLGLTAEAFVAAHCARRLRVLAVGFAPGFIYCGFHPDGMVLPRRTNVRPSVPAGTVLFAAGQTAVTSTAIPTGWHVIGRTDFRNFDPAADPSTRLHEGDEIAFEAMS